MAHDPRQLGLPFGDEAPHPAADGLTRWHQERERTMAELGRQLGVPLEATVEVILKGGVCLRGVLQMAGNALPFQPRRDFTLKLRINRCTFLPSEIESCVRLD